MAISMASPIGVWVVVSRHPDGYPIDKQMFEYLGRTIVKPKLLICVSLVCMAGCVLPISPVGDESAASLQVDHVENFIVVPGGSAPVPDGSMSPGEWDDAWRGELSDGGQILLMHSDEDLYLGLRTNSPDMFVTNIFILQDEQVAVLHSSAALGTAIFSQDGDGWQQTKGFEWRCRSTGDGTTAQAERESFLLNEGWLANNSMMGTPEEVEYQLKISDHPIQLAVQIIPANALDVRIYWPLGLADDIVEPMPGGLSDTLNLDPTQWAVLEFSE
jgi:hypothetical protein